MKTFHLSVIILALSFATQMPAQQATNAANNNTVTNASAMPRANPAIAPAKHNGKRTDLVMQRAKEAPGGYDIAFIGDSITEGWEGPGKNVWQKFYGGRKCIDLGVGGDRTEHVLWRFENGQLDGLKPKAVVLMIGTNNSNNNKDGTEHYSTGEILEGVQAIVKQLRARLPDTKLVVLGIFPRGGTFSAQRGKLLQINQALARLHDGKMVHFIDFGPQLIEDDGSISKEVMPDKLHLSERGYTIWAEAIEPKLKELL